MATHLTITLPDNLRDDIESAAKDAGTSVDQIAVAALKREVSRRWLEKIKREAETNREGKSDEEVEEIVDRAIREVRQESRRSA